jgi:hypothetical protein
MEDTLYRPQVHVTAAIRPESAVTASMGTTPTQPRLAPGSALLIILVISLLMWAGVISLVYAFWRAL